MLEQFLLGLINGDIRLINAIDNALKVFSIGEIKMAKEYVEATLISLRLANDKLAEFRKKNIRRLELIKNQYAHFTNEELLKKFSGDNWLHECEQKIQANLSVEERQELKELQEWVNQFLSQIAPSLRDAVAAGREDDEMQALQKILS